jgi:hypothetical protein
MDGAPGRSVRAVAGAALAFAAAVGVVGCGAQPTAPDQFLAFASSFDGFRNWPSAPATPSPNLPAVPGGDGVDAGAVDGGTTDAGVVHRLPLTVYWNHAPPSGSTKFPLGTIIVKETNDADITQRQVFAMVKRGADYNAGGAVDWEWFDLANVADGTETVSWHGYGPTGSADTYGGNPHVCNDCHALAVSNDYVWSSALQLSNF